MPVAHIQLLNYTIELYHNYVECIQKNKMEKQCGLQYEGTLRNADVNNQGICDASMYGLLAEDYYNSKS
ncbi:hypothetical protein [Clostridium sp.]|uniref:hypothetical protein n=1 Tax=Clostridium sp. TaxID=1506 RepID=UPI003464627A